MCGIVGRELGSTLQHCSSMSQNASSPSQVSPSKQVEVLDGLIPRITSTVTEWSFERLGYGSWPEAIWSAQLRNQHLNSKYVARN